jgi:hypothetical protein
MNFLKSFAVAVAVMTAGAVDSAEIFKDYTPSKAIVNMTMVKVNPNRIDDYLGGLRQTWQTGCDVQKKMGHVTDCWIMVNEANAAGPFNVVLAMVFKDSASMEPNEERHKAFQAEWRKALAEDKRKNLVEGYEEIRTQWGEGNYRIVEWK